jgi:uncharacterized OsmC-like protein
MEQGEVRKYAVEARSTKTLGRVLWQARQQHFVADGPVQNGCPGEAMTPAELFLAGIACCGVELVQVLAQREEIPLRGVEARIEGWIDRDHPVRTDRMVFNGARMHLRLSGVNGSQAALLIEKFEST